eukprot:5682207-Amphidinium_carterae.1
MVCLLLVARGFVGPRSLEASSCVPFLVMFCSPVTLAGAVAQRCNVCSRSGGALSAAAGCSSATVMSAEPSVQES